MDWLRPKAALRCSPPDLTVCGVVYRILPEFAAALLSCRLVAGARVVIAANSSP